MSVSCGDNGSRLWLQAIDMAKGKRSTVERKRQHPMLPRVAGPAPYEWLLGSIDQYADDNDVRNDMHGVRSRSAACCILLAKGLRLGLDALRVLRPFPTKRGTHGKPGASEACIIPAFTLSDEFYGLPDDLEDALVALRETHSERAGAAFRALAKPEIVRGSHVRGWRTTVDGKDAVTVRMVGDVPEAAMVDLCDSMSGDIGLPDVMRALWASALESEGLAPKGWDKRHVVGVGRIWTADHEIR